MVGAKRNGKWTSLYTHRIAWEAARGPIPEGMVVCHHCDNPPCVNIEHLFLGTQADNLRDMRSKGREGSSITAHNRTKTHCPVGHGYTSDGTYVNPRGGRECRICRAERGRRRRSVA